jgi:hypothetical protein
MRGMCQIQFPPPPPGPSFSGTNFIWNFTNGIPFAQFYVLAATNIAQPETNWTSVSTNEFDKTGNGIITLPMEPDQPYCFYRIALIID